MITLTLNLIAFLFILMLGAAENFIFKTLLLTIISIAISWALLPHSVDKLQFNLRACLQSCSGERDFKHALRFVGYVVWLCKEIFLSSLVIIKIILQPNRLQLDPVVGTLKIQQQDDRRKTILANSITLTPGTITISLDNNTVEVHTISREHFKMLKKSLLTSYPNKLRSVNSYS